MPYQIDHLINGKQVAGTSNHFQELYNPVTGELIGKVALADQAEINQAVAAAKNAFPVWAQTPANKRAQILFTYKNLIEQHMDELAHLISNEHGKTLSDACGSIQRGLAVVEFACNAPAHLKGEFSENVGPGIDCYSVRQPLGVCVGITPFNFPAMIPLWMFPLALVCGNTFILKPSERDPSCPFRLAELLQQAGLPDGVLNVINGDKTAVDALLAHPDVKAVSSVGSTVAAKHIYTTAAAHGKRVQAFGGAKNHCVIMPDADIDQTVDAIMGAAYGSAGERCMAISVAVAVGDKVADELIKRLTPKVQTLQIGASTAPETEMGPLVTREHLQRVQAYVATGIEEGAQLVVDGRKSTNIAFPQGNFMGGCLFDRVTPKMKIYQEEIFGPVLSVVRVPDFTTALTMINEHPYGNGTAIFTRDGEVARTFATQVQAGMVGINIPIPVPAAQYSFGGWKNSFFGDLDMHGPEGIQFYTKLKTITSRWLKGSRGAEYKMPTL